MLRRFTTCRGASFSRGIFTAFCPLQQHAMPCAGTLHLARRRTYHHMFWCLLPLLTYLAQACDGQRDPRDRTTLWSQRTLPARAFCSTPNSRCVTGKSAYRRDAGSWAAGSGPRLPGAATRYRHLPAAAPHTYRTFAPPLLPTRGLLRFLYP